MQNPLDRVVSSPAGLGLKARLPLLNPRLPFPRGLASCWAMQGWGDLLMKWAPPQSVRVTRQDRKRGRHSGLLPAVSRPRAHSDCISAGDQEEAGGWPPRWGRSGFQKTRKTQLP